MVLEDSFKSLCDVSCSVLCDEPEALASKEDAEEVNALKASDDFAPP